MIFFAPLFKGLLQVSVDSLQFMTVPVKDMNRSMSAESLEVELSSGRGLPLTAQLQAMKLSY